MKKLLLFFFLLSLINNCFTQTCDQSVVPPAVINGINVTATFTGSVNTYPSAYTSCVTTTPENSVYLGQSGSFSYTIVFSGPVNDVVIALTATGQTANENFIFTTNAGTPSIGVLTNCFSTINGNEIVSGLGADSQGGGGEFVISATSSFTSLTITGSGGENGALLSICSNSIIPADCNAGSIAPSLSATSITNACGVLTADLNSITADNTPAGTSLSWHTSSPATTANMITGSAVSAASPGTYFAAFYDAVNDCFSTNVSPVDLIESSPIDAGPDLSICNGDPVTLTGSSGSAFVWDNGVSDGVSFTPVATTTYTLSGNDLNGCPSSDQVIVTVINCTQQPCDQSVVPPAVINGINVTATSSGSVSTYPSAFTSCTTTTPANSVYLGSGGTFSYTMIFSAPVNDVVIALTATGQTANENFIFTTNAGTPSIITLANCFSTVNGNEIVSGLGADSQGGGGEFVISAAGGFTSLTITGNGGTAGALLSICSNSIVPSDCNAGSIAPNLSTPFLNSACGQTTVDLNSVTADNTPAGTSLSWHTGSPATSANMISGLAVSAATAGTYFAAFYDNVNDCYSTATSFVDVNSPNGVFSAGPDQSVCNTDPVILSGSNGTSYNWDNGVVDGISFVPAATTTYTLSGTDVNGCPATDQVTVTVVNCPQQPCDQSVVPPAVVNGINVTATSSGSVSTYPSAYTSCSTTTPANSVYLGQMGSFSYTLFFSQPVNDVVIAITAAGLPGDENFIFNTGSGTPSITALANCFSVINGNEILSGQGSGSGGGGGEFVITGPSAFTSLTITGSGGLNGSLLSICSNSIVIDECEAGTIAPNLSASTLNNDCGATTADLNLITADNTPTGTSLSWHTGSPATSANMISVTDVIAGAYFAAFYDAVNDCFSTNTSPVDVIISSSLISAGPDVSICEGESLTLSGSNGSGFTWDNGVSDGVSLSPLTTTTYTLSGTDNNACPGTDQVTVTVNTLPTIDAGLDDDVCTNSSITLSASGGNTYVWDNSAVDNVAFNIAATTTFTVTGTDINGCQNTDDLTITVLALPTVGAGSDVVLCENETVTLNGSGAVSYSWDNGITDGISFSPTATTTYTVTGTDAFACENTDQVTVTVNTLPNVNAGADINTCTGDAVTLSGSGAASLTWDNGVTDGVSFTPAATTTYTLIGIDGNNCQNSDQLTVTVNALPIIDAGLDDDVCTNSSITLLASGGDTYVWDNGAVDNVAFNIAATTTFTVTGTDINGCENTDDLTITVLALPTVGAGSDITICENETVTLNGAGAVSYSWNNGISDGVTFTPVATTTYTVTGTDGNSCTNTDQVLVTVNALPNVNAGADINGCAGDVVTLSGSGAASLTWDNGVTDGVSFTPSATTTYTLIGIDGNNCQNSDQLTVTVNSLPTIDAGLDDQVCTNSSITLSASGGDTYLWDNGAVDNVAFNITATTTFTVTGTDINGCENTDDLTITVLALPTVGAGSDVIICENETVTLNGSGTVSYSWDNGISDGISFNPAATTTYTVTGTDANGCSNTDQVLVTVNNLPNVNAGPDVSLCIGGSVSLSGSGATTLTWDNGVIDGVIFTPSATTTYTLLGIDGNNCQNTDQVTVTVNALPSIDAGPDLLICANNVITLSASGGLSYSWDQGVLDGVGFIPTLSGTYTVLGTDINGCQNSDQLDVTVNPIPVADFSIDPMSIDELNPSIITSNTSIGATTYEWSFGDGSVSDLEQPAYTYSTFDTDDYLIQLIAINEFNCRDTALASIEVTKVLLYYIPNSFTPNGDELNNNFTPVFSETFDPEEYVLKIYNRWGEVIFESLDFRIGWDGTYMNQMVKSDIYTWQLHFRIKDQSEAVDVTGTINLIK